MAPVYFGRGQQHKFHALIAAEEEEWNARMTKEKNKTEVGGAKGTSSFEEYREKSRAAGMM